LTSSETIISPLNDPLSLLQRRRRRVLIAGAAVALVATFWVVWPLIAPQYDDVYAAGVPSAGAARENPGPRARSATDPRPPATLDAEAFQVALWTPPPLKNAVVAVPPPPPPPPFKLQLLGIAGDGTADSPLRACLYDPETDRVLLVAQGDTVKPFLIRRLTRENIEFVDGTRVERLTLREPSSAGAAFGSLGGGDTR